MMMSDEVADFAPMVLSNEESVWRDAAGGVLSQTLSELEGIAVSKIHGPWLFDDSSFVKLCLSRPKKQV